MLAVADARLRAGGGDQAGAQGGDRRGGSGCGGGGDVDAARGEKRSRITCQQHALISGQNFAKQATVKSRLITRGRSRNG